MSNTIYAMSKTIYAMSNTIYAMSNTIYAMSNAIYAMNNTIHAMSKTIYAIRHVTPTHPILWHKKTNDVYPLVFRNRYFYEAIFEFWLCGFLRRKRRKD